MTDRPDHEQSRWAAPGLSDEDRAVRLLFDGICREIGRGGSARQEAHIVEAFSAVRRDALGKPAAFAPTHRHYKGGLYQLLGYGRHSESEEELAFYRSSEGRLWVRPRAMFDEPGRFVLIKGPS